MIVRCLTSSGKYFMHVQDIINIVNKFYQRLMFDLFRSSIQKVEGLKMAYLGFRDQKGKIINPIEHGRLK